MTFATRRLVVVLAFATRGANTTGCSVIVTTLEPSFGVFGRPEGGMGARDEYEREARGRYSLARLRRYRQVRVFSGKGGRGFCAKSNALSRLLALALP